MNLNDTEKIEQLKNNVISTLSAFSGISEICLSYSGASFLRTQPKNPYEIELGQLAAWYIIGYN